MLTNADQYTNHCLRNGGSQIAFQLDAFFLTGSHSCTYGADRSVLRPFQRPYSVLLGQSGEQDMDEIRLR